jgi:hypothetical protein
MSILLVPAQLGVFLVFSPGCRCTHNCRPCKILCATIKLQLKCYVSKLGQLSKKFILSGSTTLEVKEAIGWLASLLPRNKSIANNKIGIFPFISVLWR